MTIVIFIVVLVVLIVVHEFGHFVVAKWAGMKVEEFGLGYPPRAATFATMGETRYTLNWIPFGGFLKILGEDGVPGGLPDPRAFTSRSRHLQALVLVAGIAMNLFLAWVLLSIVLMAPRQVSPHEFVAGKALIPAFIEGAVLTSTATQAVAVGLADFFLGVFTLRADFSQVSGPVGIAGVVGDAARAGWQQLFSLSALISINLALINLIPIPALDGGRLLFVAIEALLRRPLNPAIAGRVNMVGFMALILLMVVVTVSDIYKLF